MAENRQRRRATSGADADGASPARNGGRGEPERQQELLAIAAQLFADHGYAGTTVRDIAREAGILSGSLYHHFDTKESMIDAILSTHVEQILSQFASIVDEGHGPTETFSRLIEASLRVMETDRAAILVYQNEARFLAEQPRFAYLQTSHREFEKIWTGVLRRGIKSGEFRADIDPKVVYRLVRDTVWTAPRWWRPSGAVKTRQFIDQYLAVLVNGVVVHA